MKLRLEYDTTINPDPRTLAGFLQTFARSIENNELPPGALQRLGLLMEVRDPDQPGDPIVARLEILKEDFDSKLQMDLSDARAVIYNPQGKVRDDDLPSQH